MSDETEGTQEPETATEDAQEAEKKPPEQIRASFYPDLLMNLGYAHNPEWEADIPESVRLGDRYREELEVTPSTDDTYDQERMRTHLLVLNPQRDLACPGGPLGISEEITTVTTTITEFIFRNVESLTRITPTLTNHFPYQIMFGGFWVNDEGNNPEAGTEITAEDLKEGKWKPNPSMAGWLCRGEASWLEEQCQHMAEKLEGQENRLVIQPLHCLHGSRGYGIVGCINEARYFHATVRVVQPESEVNGSNPLAENYAFFGPDVIERKDGEEGGAVGWQNFPALAAVVMTDNLVLSGFHRVEETARGILKVLGENQEDWPCRLYYLRGGVPDPSEIPEEFIPIDSIADIPPLPEEEEEDDKGLKFTV